MNKQWIWKLLIVTFFALSACATVGAGVFHAIEINANGACFLEFQYGAVIRPDGHVFKEPSEKCHIGTNKMISQPVPETLWLRWRTSEGVVREEAIPIRKLLGLKDMVGAHVVANIDGSRVTVRYRSDKDMDFYGRGTDLYISNHNHQ